MFTQDLAPPNAATPTGDGATVTIVRDNERRLTKQVSTTEKKTLKIEGGARLVEGTFKTISVPTPSALADIIKHLQSNEALIHGVAKNGEDTGLIATKRAIADGTASEGAIPKTKESFEFRTGSAGILMLDLDLNDAPSAIAPTTLDDARARLIRVAPALEHAPMLALPSTSANIFRLGSERPLRGLSGLRIYVFVEDAADIPELGQRLHQRLILAGEGFPKIHKSGTVHVASILDTTVWSPERLDYTAGAVCGKGLEQRRGPRVWKDGGEPLALHEVPALTEPEAERVRQLEADIRDKAKPSAERRRAEWVAERKEAGLSTRVTWSPSTGAVDFLEAAHEVRLATGAWVSVAEILQQPDRYEGVQCYDPLEPDYDGDRVVGIIYAKNNLIHSKAHGGANYVLRADVADEFSAVPGTSSQPALQPLRTLSEGIADFNRRFAFVRTLGAILYTPAPGTWELMSMKAWRDFTKNEWIFNGKSWVSLAQCWLGSEDRRTVSRLVFEPDLPALRDVPNPNEDPHAAFNIWPGFAIEPSKEGECDLFLKHLRDVIADGDEQVYQWVLMWLAALVQGPAMLPGTALVLQGPQGAGKDTVGEVMRAIIGASLHTTIADPEQLTGKFNAPHEGKLLLQVEEGFFAGNPQHRGKLKHMITAPKVSIERKHMDRYEVTNCARLLITSNEDWVVPAEKGNRRFMVVKVSGRYANDLAYHRALRQQMFENGGCARLLEYLLNEVDVDWDLIRRPLPTEALRDQQLASLDQDRRWLYEVLDEGVLPGDVNGDGSSPKDALFASYGASRQDRRGTKTALTQMLKQYDVKLPRPRVGSTRRRVYQFPPLPVCRARFASDHLAVAPEWDPQEEWAKESLDELLAPSLPLKRAS